MKNRLAAIVDAQWRKDHPERAKVLGGHADDTYDQRMADALLAMAGVHAQATSTSSGPGGASHGDHTTQEKRGTQTTSTAQKSRSGSSQTYVESEAGASLNMTGVHAQATSTSSGPDGAPNVKNAAVQDHRPPTTGGTQGSSSDSSQPHVGSEQERIGFSMVSKAVSATLS